MSSKTTKTLAELEAEEKALEKKEREAADKLEKAHIIGVIPGKIGLWEQHLAHPGGEVLIKADKPVLAALTPAVLNRIHDKMLRKATAAEVKALVKEQREAAAVAKKATS